MPISKSAQRTPDDRGEAAMTRRLLCVVSGLALLAASQAAQAAPDPDVYYKLTTQFRGTGSPLDVFNGGPKNNQVHLADDQNVTGQFWRFTPAGDGYFRLSSKFRGPDMCLDIAPETNKPELRACGDYSGQYWRLRRDNQFYRLTTQFRGPDMCLDVAPETNQPELRPCGAYTGQFWQLNPT